MTGSACIECCIVVLSSCSASFSHAWAHYIFCEYADLAQISVRLADIFHILVRLTATNCCKIATATIMDDKIARLTDIRAKNERLFGYRAPYNGTIYADIQCEVDSSIYQ